MRKGQRLRNTHDSALYKGQRLRKAHDSAQYKGQRLRFNIIITV